MAPAPVTYLFNQLRNAQFSMKKFEVYDHDGQPAILFTHKNSSFILTDDSKILRLSENDNKSSEVASKRTDIHRIVKGAQKTLRDNASQFPNLIGILDRLTENHQARRANRKKLTA